MFTELEEKQCLILRDQVDLVELAIKIKKSVLICNNNCGEYEVKIGCRANTEERNVIRRR